LFVVGLVKGAQNHLPLNLIPGRPDWKRNCVFSAAKLLCSKGYGAKWWRSICSPEQITTARSITLRPIHARYRPRMKAQRIQSGRTDEARRSIVLAARS